MSMAVFEFSPVAARRTDARWQVSWHTGRCRVVAPSAQQARLWAASAFTVAADRAEPLNLPSPWLLAELVTVADTQTVSSELEGTVHIHDPADPAFWFAVNSGDGSTEPLGQDPESACAGPFEAECSWARLKEAWLRLVSPLARGAA